MKPTLRLSKDDILLVLKALDLVADKYTNPKVLTLESKLLEEYAILKEHTCTEYHYDCPACNRDNGSC